MLFGDARSGVFDMEKQLAALRTVPQRNGAFVSELHRIVDEVGDDLNQPVLVADHAALRVVLPEDQLDGFVLDLETERAHRLLAHAVDVHPAVIEFEGACFDLRKVQNVGYEFEQQLVVLLDDTHVLTPLPDVVRLGQQVRKSHDGVQGRADFVAHVGQKSRFEPVADLGLVLGLDQVLLGLLQLRDVEIDAYHLDLRRVGVQRIAHHIDAGPSRRFAFGRNPQVKRESVGFARLDAPDFPEYGVAVLRVHVVVNPDHLRHRRIAFLSQIMKPLRHGITVARHQVETRIAHLAEAAHQRKRTFELGKTAVSFVDLGVVDIDDHEIDQLAVHVVEHGDRRIYLHVSVLARRIVAVQPVEMVIEFERLLLPVAHVLADLAGDKRVAEEIDAQHLLLRFESEDFEVLVIEVHQIPLPVVQLDADLHVVEDVAQQLFAVEKRFVGVVHVRRVGKETDHLVLVGRIENRMYPVFRFLVETVMFDVIAAVEHLQENRHVEARVESQLGGAFAYILLPEHARNLVGGIIRIQNPEIDRLAGVVAQHLQPGVTQRHVAVKAFEIGPLGLRLPFGALEFDTKADNVHQRREPLVILPAPRPGFVHDVDAGVSPHLVARGERYGDQRFDVLHGEHLLFAERFVGQFVERGDDDGIAVLDTPGPPRHLVHRQAVYQILLGRDVLGRNLVCAVVRPALAVEFDDIGPAAVEHGLHVGEYLVDDDIQIVGFQQRQQRMRNAVEPVQQVVDLLLFGRIGLLRGIGHPEISRQQHSAVLGRLLTQQFPVTPDFAFRPPQRIKVFVSEISPAHPDRSEGILPVGRVYHIPKLFVTHVARRKPQQIAESFRYVEHTTFAVGLPPTYSGIPHDLLQDFVFFHSIIFSVPVRPECLGPSIQK